MPTGAQSVRQVFGPGAVHDRQTSRHRTPNGPKSGEVASPKRPSLNDVVRHNALVHHRLFGGGHREAISSSKTPSTREIGDGSDNRGRNAAPCTGRSVCSSRERSWPRSRFESTSLLLAGRTRVGGDVRSELRAFVWRNLNRPSLRGGLSVKIKSPIVQSR